MSADNAQETAVVASKVTMLSSGATVAFGLTLNELGVVVGIVTAVLGLLVNIYYRRKEYRLRELAYLNNKELPSE
jgi:Bacteriophage holin family HP1